MSLQRGCVLVGLDDLNGFFGGKRALEYGGVAEQAIELGEDEFGNGHVLVALDRCQPGVGGFMPR